VDNKRTFSRLLAVRDGCAAGERAKPEKPESELRLALAGFIRAFDDLDWDHFRLTFVDDATVF
jgi:hypothetical protein